MKRSKLAFNEIRMTPQGGIPYVFACNYYAASRAFLPVCIFLALG